MVQLLHGASPKLSSLALTFTPPCPCLALTPSACLSSCTAPTPQLMELLRGLSLTPSSAAAKQLKEAALQELAHEVRGEG